MVSTFTPNIQLEEPARGDQVGVWDVPVNNNMTIVDRVCGGVATIGLNNSNVVLSAAQYESKTIIFNSTLTASVVITFPSSFTKSYEILNNCTGSSAFVISLQVGTSDSICPPPGEYVDVINNGGVMRFKNLGRVGSYVDFATTSVPLWISNCTIAPYLQCVGGSFSSATYPQLFTFLGGTTQLPDARGRTRYAPDAGTGRITSVIGSPNTVGGTGGDQLMQVHSHANSLSDPGHTHSHNAAQENNQTATSGGGIAINTPANATINSAVTGISINNANAGSGGAQNMPPMYIGGITMIRAA
jgi:Phage Tail Collar Domain